MNNLNYNLPTIWSVIDAIIDFINKTSKQNLNNLLSGVNKLDYNFSLISEPSWLSEQYKKIYSILVEFISIITKDWDINELKKFY